jgi:hypothetical protein
VNADPGPKNVLDSRLVLKLVAVSLRSFENDPKGGILGLIFEIRVMQLISFSFNKKLVICVK